MSIVTMMRVNRVPVSAAAIGGNILPGSAAMIWNSVKHITFAEIAAWIFFLLATAALGSLGVRFASEGVSVALVVVWCVLFLAVYRIRYKRL